MVRQRHGVADGAGGAAQVAMRVDGDQQRGGDGQRLVAGAAGAQRGRVEQCGGEARRRGRIARGEKRQRHVTDEEARAGHGDAGARGASGARSHGRPRRHRATSSRAGDLRAVVRARSTVAQQVAQHALRAQRPVRLGAIPEQVPGERAVARHHRAQRQQPPIDAAALAGHELVVAAHRQGERPDATRQFPPIAGAAGAIVGTSKVRSRCSPCRCR